MHTTNVFATLIEPLQRALTEEGYDTPTPIQVQVIPHLLEGRDLLGCAQTGTGKTAAFSLPLLQQLTQTPRQVAGGHVRALILTPTRELAAQIGESLRTYGRHVKIRHAVIFGGVGQHPQVQAIRRGLDVLVATPGRLLDLMAQGHVRLERVEFFVLDEADRMLDMGFVPSVRKVVAQLPKKRHSLFFSVTMPPVVATLAQEFLHDPVRVTIDPGQPTVERIAQKVLFVDKDNKNALLLNLLAEHAMDKVLVFTRTKHGADKVVSKLSSAGVSASAIHGNKSQTTRTASLQGFKMGRIRALVATDLAARGLDVDGITHVINYDLPEEPETYVHRIGRTGRAGSAGDAFSFCAARERDSLRNIEKMIRKKIPVDARHIHHSEVASKATGADARPEPRNGRPASRSRSRAAPGRAATPKGKAEPARSARPGSKRPGTTARATRSYGRR